MTPPTKPFPEQPIDWQLIRNEWKVMQDYSCHDTRPGLSKEDIGFLQKQNPTLMREMISSYQNGDPNLPFTVDGFARGFVRIGLANLSKVLNLKHNTVPGVFLGPRDWRFEGINTPLHFGFIGFNRGSPLHPDFYEQVCKFFIEALSKHGVMKDIWSFKWDSAKTQSRIPAYQTMDRLHLIPNDCGKPNRKKAKPTQVPPPPKASPKKAPPGKPGLVS